MDNKKERYRLLLQQAEALINQECGWIANYSNVCAAIQDSFDHWWCGFYFVNSRKQLELGPFQGPVACTQIDYKKGVCGSAWAAGETIIVPNVHEFDGHIACSSESNSEIVVPIYKNGQIVGVLDIDSIHFNQFDEIDKEYLEQLVAILPEVKVNF